MTRQPMERRRLAQARAQVLSSSLRYPGAAGRRLRWVLALAWLASLVLVFWLRRGELVALSAVLGVLLLLELTQGLAWNPFGRWNRSLRRFATRLVAGELSREAEVPRLLRPLAQALLPAWEALRLELQRREHEAARLRRMLESLDTAVISLDAERRLLYLNRAGQQLLRTGEAPRLGERLAALARISQVARWLDEVAADGQSRFGRVELADGRSLQVEIVALGEPPGSAVILARDASEMVRLETLRRDFIAAVSHELRTPVTSTRGYAELLLQEDDLPPEQRRQFLATIVANAHRLEKLAQDLVTLSSIETGHYPFHYQTFNAAQLLAPAVAVVRPLAAAQGCTVGIEAAESGWVRADSDALHRALLNLVENALMHGGAGTQVFVSGAATALESGQKAYRIEVRDTGAGISSADQPHIFERFYRVDKSHARASGGSGLGLALVKHIVQEHGGQVTVRSRLGEGSTFAILLPLREPPAAGAGGAGPDDSVDAVNAAGDRSPDAAGGGSVQHQSGRAAAPADVEASSHV